MVKFDKDGFFIKQIINFKVEHDNYHSELYPDLEEEKVIILEYDKSKYLIHGHTTHKDSVKGILQIVPLYQTNYRGKKFDKWNRKGSGALAIVSKSTKSNKMRIIKVLIPK